MDNFEKCDNFLVFFSQILVSGMQEYFSYLKQPKAIGSIFILAW